MFSKMEKPVLIMLGISLVLIVSFAFVLRDDYIQYQAHMAEILEQLHLQDPSDLEGSFFAVVVFRAVLFLVPAFILGFAAIAMHVMDNKKPNNRKRGFR